jgi:hypothetical protein
MEIGRPSLPDFNDIYDHLLLLSEYINPWLTEADIIITGYFYRLRKRMKYILKEF